MSIQSRRVGQTGFTYLGVLFAIALLGVGLTAVSEVWVTASRRQNLAELEWIGRQFTASIGSYYESSPGSVKVYPKSFDDLLHDRRHLFMKRHLRTVYLNPFTGKYDWELVTTGEGRIRGVRTAVTTDVAHTIREYVHQQD